jgi:sugar phosphate isomerase/epimerase
MKPLKVDIGLCGAFVTRRWEEPEHWMRLTRELGYDYHSFCGDVLDPFFSGDRSYQLETAAAVRESAERYGVEIVDFYTGTATHRFHGLSHSDPRCRERMCEWIYRAYEIAAAMGVDVIGGRWDALPVEVLSDPARAEAAWQRLVQTFRDLSVRAKQQGMQALYNEQMYIPSEVPWTLAQMERFLLECNTGNPDGVPIRVTLDTGHVAGVHYGGTGEDLDYRAWQRRFAAQAAIMHLQQTTPDASHHWGFTPEFNARGYINVELLLQDIAAAHAEYAGTPLSRCLPAADRVILVVEVIPGSTRTEAVVLDELRRTAEYLREYIPEGGLLLT